MACSKGLQRASGPGIMAALSQQRVVYFYPLQSISHMENQSPVDGNLTSGRIWQGANLKTSLIRVGLDSVGISHGDDDQYRYRRGQKRCDSFSRANPNLLELLQHVVKRQGVDG